MNRIAKILLILSLVFVIVTLVSCDSTGSGNFFEDVISSTLSDDTPMARDFANFKPFMQTKGYFEKFCNCFKEIANVVKDVKADNLLSILGLIGAVLANWAAWAAAIIVYGLCTIVMLFYDIILLGFYCILFILLLLIYAFNGLLLLLV